MGQHALPKRRSEFVVGHPFPAQAENRKLWRQQAVEHQVVERGNQASTGKVSGSAENDERAGFDRRNGFLGGRDVDSLGGRHVSSRRTQSMRAGFGTSLNNRLTMSLPQFSRSGSVAETRKWDASSPRAASREAMNRGTSTGAVSHRPRRRKNAFTKSSKKFVRRNWAVAGLSAIS